MNGSLIYSIFSVGLALSPALAHAEPAGSTEAPVVRAAPGNLGMFFRFGGLATLNATGNSHTVGAGLAFTDVGLKYVLNEQLQIPVFVGTGVQFNSLSPGTSSTDAGIELGGGIEYHFRIWRRISPFVGGIASLTYTYPAGGNAWLVGFGVGPEIGVEYFIADRVSLTAQYMISFALAYQKTGANSSTTGVGFASQAGGALNLTVYF